MNNVKKKMTQKILVLKNKREIYIKLTETTRKIKSEWKKETEKQIRENII